MVDPQIRRDLLVARGAVSSLPFDDPGRPAAQPLRGAGEPHAVAPGRGEVPQVAPRPVGNRQTVVDGILDVFEGGWAHPERVLEIRVSEHAQPGDDLGDLGSQSRHVRLPGRAA